MEKAKALAFLLCEHARKESDGKIALHGLFDRIVIPPHPGHPKLFYVFYKIDVKHPCTVKLRVLNPQNLELGAKYRDLWRDSFTELGAIQAVWPLTTTPFEQPGPYRLELREESDGTDAGPLASTVLVVDREDEP